MNVTLGCWEHKYETISMEESNSYNIQNIIIFLVGESLIYSDLSPSQKWVNPENLEAITTTFTSNNNPKKQVTRFLMFNVLSISPSK